MREEVILSAGVGWRMREEVAKCGDGGMGGWRRKIEKDGFFPWQGGVSGFRPRARQRMVVVAQLVEPRIVIPVVAGSSPVDHPIFPVGSHVVDAGGREGNQGE